MLTCPVDAVECREREMSPVQKSFTLISAHFGDIFWIGQMTAHIRSMSPSASIHAIRIADQDRSADTVRRLEALPGHPEVLSFPEDPLQIERHGHDHAATLNRFMQLDYATSHIILLDSDCFPVTADWINRLTSILAEYDAIVARDPIKHGLSHPCFMVLPVAALPLLDFSEGLMEAGIDTGRLVGLQLCKQGRRVWWDTPVRAFNGKRGEHYLNSSLYHHGSASFASSRQLQLHRQANLRVERFFRTKISRGDFTLTWPERTYLWLLRRLS